MRPSRARASTDSASASSPSPPAFASTGRYAWSRQLSLPNWTQTVSGVAYVVTQDASPLGAGWLSGRREVPAAEFFVGYFATAVGEGELLRSITVPALAADAGTGYSTVAVGADSKAIARAAAVVRGNGRIEDARVVLACVSPAPM